MSGKRGAFLLLEGVDRSGKTTQTKLLQEALQAKGHGVALRHFPDRTTAIGQSINSYLTSKAALNDRVIHLLFSANRWEAAAEMEELIKNGTTVIVDRYSYSGVAFSVAKNDMELEWCWGPELGLPLPDGIIYLDMPVEEAANRAEYGNERYETPAFQHKVAAVFEHMTIMSETESERYSKWYKVDATKSKEDVHKDVMEIAEKCLRKCERTQLECIV